MPQIAAARLSYFGCLQEPHRSLPLYGVGSSALGFIGIQAGNSCIFPLTVNAEQQK